MSVPIKPDSATLSTICKSPDEFLGTLDIAALNIMCAADLPNSPQNPAKIMDWLDEAAHHVGLETRRHLYRFRDNPYHYKNSPGYFYCYFLLQVLQEDFGVKYNPRRVRDVNFQDPNCHNPDFRDSRDLFVHGIIEGSGGTCASMPVLYVAVGRKLGYPLKLVTTRGHLFFRWDDPSGSFRGTPEVFNIEGAGSGIASFDDEHYKTWPEPWSKEQTEAQWHLQSLTPRQELAAFLVTRAECLLDNGQPEEARVAYHWANNLDPKDIRYQRNLHKINKICNEKMLALVDRLDHERRLELQRRENRQKTLAVHSHGGYCQCWHCKQAKPAKVQSIRGHAPTCRCAACLKLKKG